MRLPPSTDQVEFYEALVNKCIGNAEEAIITMLWFTGMHVSTLAQRDWHHHICPDGTLVFSWKRPKTHKQMIANVPKDRARPVIDCLKNDNEGIGDLIPNSIRTIQRHVEAIGLRAGYPGISPLTLRHSRAIYLMDQGMPVNRVAAALGCSYSVLERHYGQIEAQRLV